MRLERCTLRSLSNARSLPENSVLDNSRAERYLGRRRRFKTSSTCTWQPATLDELMAQRAGITVFRHVERRRIGDFVLSSRRNAKRAYILKTAETQKPIDLFERRSSTRRYAQYIESYGHLSGRGAFRAVLLLIVNYTMLLQEACVGRPNIRRALFHGSDHALPLFGSRSASTLDTCVVYNLLLSLVIPPGGLALNSIASMR
jgi:hypothetical protein